LPQYRHLMSSPTKDGPTAGHAPNSIFPRRTGIVYHPGCQAGRWAARAGGCYA